MGQLHPKVIGPKIRMGIKVDDVKLGIPLHRRPDGAERHKMLSADHKRQLPIVQDLCRSLLDLRQHSL